MSIGARIRERRKACGLTLEELSAKVNTSRQTVSRYETGVIKNIPSDKIEELAYALETTPSYLMGWTDDPYDYESDLSARLASIPDAMRRAWLEDGLSGEEMWRRYQAVEDSAREELGKRFSDAALEVAKIYDTLDPYGQDAVREVAKIEQARCEDEDRLLHMTTPEMEEEGIVIDDFTFAPAAGPLLGVAGQERVPYVLQPGDPRGAVYTTRVSGDSMEPYFPDGTRVFVNMDQVRNGDVGIFCVDGATVIKQFYRDPLGMIYLFSLNRKRADADLVFGPYDRRTLVCQGRVMDPRRFPLPQ